MGNRRVTMVPCALRMGVETASSIRTALEICKWLALDLYRDPVVRLLELYLRLKR